MADVSFAQSSFLGGEWSPFFQGRFDLPKYKTAMSVCLNALPLEEGCCVRRPGTRFLATTRNGQPGRVLPFTFSEAQPYNMEFTDGYVRFFNGTQLVYQSDITDLVSVTTDNPGIFTAGTTDWVVGDTLLFLFNSVGDSADASILRNRQFRVATKPNGEQFTLTDPISGLAVDGSTVGFVPERDTLQVAKVLEFVTPWTGTLWNKLRLAQTSDVAILMTNSTHTKRMDVTAQPTSTSFASFAFSDMDFSQGPFLDPITDSIATPSGLSGTITIGFAFPTYSGGTYYYLGQRVVDGGSSYQSIQQANIGHTPAASPTFWKVIDGGLAYSNAGGATSTDIGRSIRLWNQPATWDAGTAYAPGDLVTFGAGFANPGTQYQAQKGNTGVPPDTSIADWAPVQGVAFWTQGVITGINTPTNITFAFAGGPLAYSGPTTLWRLGIYSNTGPSWPTCGTYMEGRLWLGGAIGNRIDGSVPHNLPVAGVTDLSFLPTNPDGTVTDASAIDYTFNSTEANPVQWMIPSQQGLVVSTLADEWLVTASQMNDPLTPSSTQARPVSKYGGAAIEPKRTGLSVVFIHKYGRRVLEMISDVFSGKFSAPNLSISAKHLTVGGIAEIAHQEELAPVIWIRTTPGNLVGITYRRISSFSTEEPTYAGWHRHELGSGRIVESVGVGPSPDGTLDTLAMVTSKGVEPRHVEVLTGIFDEDNTIYDAWFLDDAVTPGGSDIVSYGGQTYVRFYGLWHLNGKTVTVWAGALDCGDYIVANGSVDVPFGAAGGLFTQAYITTLSGSGRDFGGLATPIDQFAIITPPVIIGTGTIQSYDPGASFSILPVIPDWTNNHVFLSLDGTGAAGAIYKMDLGSGALLASVHGDTLGLSGADGFVIHPFTRGGDGSILWCSGSGSSGTYRKVDPATLTLTASSGATYDKPHALAATAYAGNNVVVVSSTLGSNLFAINTDTMVAYGSSTVPTMPGLGGGSSVWVDLVAGPSGGTTGVVYGIGHPDFFAGASFTQAMPLYAMTVTATGVTGVKRGSILPSQVDPTWTTFAQAYSGFGIWYDPADGNILFTCGTLDSVTNQYYLVKARTSDAKVLWTVPLISVTQGNPLSRIHGGLFIYLLGGIVYNVDTLTGAYSTSTIPGVSAATGQAFDGVTGQLLTYITSFVGTTTGAPLPQNMTPVTFSGLWATAIIGNSFKGSSTQTTRLSIPVVIGYPYTTQGQLLRPATPPEAGSANGPALGKRRRNHMFSALLHGTQGVSFGTDFTRMRPAQFKTEGGTPYPVTQLFDGVYWDTVDDDYSFEGKLCWEVTRPYPVSVLALGGMIHTMDY